MRTFPILPVTLAVLALLVTPGVFAQDSAARLVQIETRLAQLEARMAAVEAMQNEHGGEAPAHSGAPAATPPADGGAGGGMGGMGHM